MPLPVARNDFNHHHHHAVLAGSCGRYSSTHRVAVTATDTFDYIDKRCNAVLATPVPVYGASGAAGVLQAAALREAEEAHSELEFEWLRQWGVQGAAHASTHGAYWAPRMRALLQSWRRLEARTAAHCRFLGRAAEDEDRGAAARALPEGVRCYDVLEQLLTKRRGVATANKQEGREGWAARERHRVYAELAPSYRTSLRTFSLLAH